MGFSPVAIVAALFMLAVFFGVGTQLLSHPARTNALLATGADTIDGVTKALEGR